MTRKWEGGGRVADPRTIYPFPTPPRQTAFSERRGVVGLGVWRVLSSMPGTPVTPGGSLHFKKNFRTRIEALKSQVDPRPRSAKKSESKRVERPQKGRRSILKFQDPIC